MEQQGAAAAFWTHDTDGQVTDIGHLHIIEAVADAHHAAGVLSDLFCLDLANLCGGKGENLQGQTGTFLSGGAMGIGGDDTNGKGLAELFQSGGDPGDDLAVLGDGSVIIQYQMSQAEVVSAGDGNVKHGFLLMQSMC